MERARRADDERRSDAVAQGRRQGYRSDRLPFPAAPQPARRLTSQGAGPREERERLRKRSVVSRRPTKDGDRPLKPRRSLSERWTASAPFRSSRPTSGNGFVEWEALIVAPIYAWPRQGVRTWNARRS